jgi:hypothetical protein
MHAWTRRRWFIDHLTSAIISAASITSDDVGVSQMILRNSALQRLQYSIYTRHGANLIFFRLVFQNLHKHGQVY